MELGEAVLAALDFCRDGEAVLERSGVGVFGLVDSFGFSFLMSWSALVLVALSSNREREELLN